MSGIKRVTPEQAKELLGQGYVYVDVRSEAEFATGHPPGAFNVPLTLTGPSGPAPNTEFSSVIEQAFGPGAKLVVGCMTGSRSRRAAEILLHAGFEEIAEMSAGFAGSRDAFGRPQPGWVAKGLPVEITTLEGHGYADVRRRVR